MESCDVVWEAASARLDGEAAGSVGDGVRDEAGHALSNRLSDDVLEAHLRSCATCSAKLVFAESIRRQVRVRSAELTHDRTTEIMAALPPRSRSHTSLSAARRFSGRDQLHPARLVLAIMAVFQSVGACAALLHVSPSWAAASSTHIGREHAVMELALAAALATGALHPKRAAALLPMVAVAAIGLFLLSVVDSASGATESGIESRHSLALLGAAAMVVVSRAMREHRPQTLGQFGGFRSTAAAK
jgi:predicted anti-sigma-YlaC factor YlaD